MTLVAQHISNTAPNRGVNDVERKALISSVIFHVILIVLTVVGLPFVAKEPLILSTPINVEIVNIDEETKTIKKAPPPELKKPQASKMTSDAPPDLSMPVEPDMDGEIIPEKILPDDPAPKPQEKPKPKTKPKPPPKEVAPIKKQKDLFSSLLKNLAPDAEEKPDEAPQDTPPQDNPEPAQIADLGEQLTISELDAFKYQIAPCWNVQSGSKYAEDLVVEVKVFMNPDKSLLSASIVDQMRYTLDSHYRAAADAAMRALRNPRCQPFKLPPEKYQQWKEMTIRFNPQEML